MELKPFEFTKKWTSASDFPTVETDETKIRADLQLLHDEAKQYLNETIIPAIENLSLTVSQVVQVTLNKDGWDAAARTQRAFADGVTADEASQMIQIIPAGDNADEYLNCGTLCVAQHENYLEFKVLSLPDSDLTVFAVLTEVAQ